MEAIAAQLEAHEDFYFFSRYMFFKQRGYKWLQSEHHQLICAALMRVYSGECTRLIINIPPRYSKTELAVVNFMAWTLGRHPDCEFIHTSYSTRLATSNSWRTRELVQHEDYSKIFASVLLRTDSTAKDEWRTSSGGCVYATGSGGTITGYGAGKQREGFGGAIIIDDPHKADEASSDVMRGNVIEWFQNTLESRKNSRHTPIIVIMQRLHEEDLSGWLLAGGNGEKWEHLCLPAVKDDDSVLWEAKHSREDLQRMSDAAPGVFCGQYQQRPAPPEGMIIKPDMISIVDALPAGLSYTRAWDLAATAGGGDWTVGAKMAKMTDGRVIIADVVRLRGGPDEIRAAIKNTADRDGAACKIKLPQDPGQAGKDQAQSLVRMLSGYVASASVVTGSKETRAEPMAAQINIGNIVMLRGEWNRDLVDEMRVFPGGTHDDIVDACSDAFTAVAGGGSGADALFAYMKTAHDAAEALKK